MASKSGNPVTTVYQCSECNHCSQDLEEATLHAVHEHGDDNEDSADDSFQQKINIKTDKDLCSSDEEYSHKYLNGQDSPKKTTFWSNGAIESLILSVQEHYEELQNRGLKKKPIWQQIKTSLQKQFPGVTAFQCEQKWRSLVQAHKKYISMSKKGTGKSRLKKPNFFYEINEIIGNECEDYDDDKVEYSASLVGDNSSLGDALCSILSQDETSYLNCEGSDSLSVFARLLSVLERREKANEVFQKRILAIEKEKLMCAQKFIEERQRFNDERLKLMKNWVVNQENGKKRKHE